MNRKEFLKTGCKLGLCSCLGVAMLNPSKLYGAEENPEVKKLKGKLSFIHKRFAKLISLMSVNLDRKTREKILESLGMACASEYGQYYTKYKNNLKGFLGDIHKIGIEQVIRDDDNKTITLIGKKSGGCFCPFVKQSVTPADFCTCSQGWQKKVFETITGKPVTVEVKGSVLMGNDRCSFVIKLA
jgi:predicted hydrocarbon binding protein